MNSVQNVFSSIFQTSMNVRLWLVGVRILTVCVSQGVLTAGDLTSVPALRGSSWVLTKRPVTVRYYNTLHQYLTISILNNIALFKCPFFRNMNIVVHWCWNLLIPASNGVKIVAKIITKNNNKQITKKKHRRFQQKKA